MNKVIGNFHIAPGKSFSNGAVHVHDLENYFKDEADHSFTHTIHNLRFGPQLPENLVQKIESRGSGVWTNHHINPLDGNHQETNEKAFNYMYFIKVVSTAYLPLGWEKVKSPVQQGHTDQPDAIPHEMVALGGMGYGYKGSIETHQYSVTSHKRNLQGGNDAQEGHKERLHARGGIPGVFFSYVRYFSCFLHTKDANTVISGHLPHESHQP